jgi:hypothetical protein
MKASSEISMTIEENTTLVRRYFEEAPYNLEVCDQIFAPQIPWHALYRTSHPDFISDPLAEKIAFTKQMKIIGLVHQSNKNLGGV